MRGSRLGEAGWIHHARLPVTCLLALGVAFIAFGCRGTVPADEARRTLATFSGVGMLPPPRADEDPTAVLGQQRDDPGAEAEERARANLAPPNDSEPAVLARFYYERSIAAGGAGRLQQRINDLKLAVSFSERVKDPGWDAGPFVLALARAELHDNRRRDGIRRLEDFVTAAASKPRFRGWLISAAYFLVGVYVDIGDLDHAERALRFGMGVWQESRGWQGQRREWVSSYEAMMRIAEGSVLSLKGDTAGAIKAFRRAVAVMSADAAASAGTDLREVATSSLAGALARQGALAEAELEARRALQGTLRRRGGNTTLAANMTNLLADVLLEQGRYNEAEALARAAQQTRTRIGTGNLGARRTLVRVLVAQGRWDDALHEYDVLRSQRWDPAMKDRVLSDPEMIMALLVRNRSADAVAVLEPVVAEERRRLGVTHRGTVVRRALLALASAAQGNRESAMRELKDVTPILLDPGLDIEDESTARAAADRRREFIIGRYIGLLADSVGSAGGPGAIAEAFQLAEAVRGRSVARALEANAARHATSLPGLAELIRRSQDAKKRVEALYGGAVNILSAPADDQDAADLTRLRGQIETLQRERQALDRQIAREYPAYAQLMNPSSGTVAQIQATLKPGEALVSTLLTGDRSFVWAVPREGPVVFAAPPMGSAKVRAMVEGLRRALDPGVVILGDIPVFDVDAAYDLYLTFLEPVKAGWAAADTLLVVPHGALGQLPFALLPTEAPLQIAEDGVLFSRYRNVSWLARSHATVVLPSAGALLTLRSMAAAPLGRRPFIGFGNPYFSTAQASRDQEVSRPEKALPTVTLRRLKPVSTAGGRLADLPPLPDTAEEIRAIASALRADQARDVFLGERANERAVMTAGLASYRIVAFATHGLVPGDVDGLTQPALALTAPEVAGVEGDGLLTMDKILGLRLNADWVVLSACNTASGYGAGSEAISGLGRAFFYAGARALLVTSWPVETTSARALTTDLFRRQETTLGLPRARALQQSMLALMDSPGFTDPRSGRVVFSYAHPIFWAAFILVGDGS